MCRITVFSSKEIPVGMKQLFFQQALLASAADWNFDGVGMTDGVTVRKGTTSILHNGGRWAEKLDPSRTWIGHARAASKGTEVTLRAAHPFVYGVGENFLHGVHNGFVRDMPIGDKAEPASDSYQAFKLLAGMLKERGDVTPQLINDWTAQFGAGSQYTFALAWRDNTYIVRGVREMHWMRVNDGVITNTSLGVLTYLKEWISQFWGSSYTLGKIQSIGEHQLCTIYPGSHTITGVSLNKPTPVADDTGMYYSWSPEDGEKLLKI